MPLLLSLFFAGLPLIGWGSDPVKGNGVRTTRLLTPEGFTRIEVHTFARTVIRCGLMPKVEVETDENLQDKLEIRVRGAALTIDTKYYLEPTFLEIRIQLPVLTGFENEGWADHRIEDIHSSQLSVRCPTGSVRLSGKASECRIYTENGSVLAGELHVERANIRVTGHGGVEIHAAQLETDLGSRGSVVNKAAPKMDALKAEKIDSPQPEIPTVSFTLKNPEFQRKRYQIQGPGGVRFRYGFSIGPLGIRKEQAPAGSKIYEETRLGLRGRLVAVLEVEQEGETVVLQHER